MTHERGYVVASVAILVFVAVLAYAFIQLLSIHKALSTFTGENMLWNVTETEREARRLSEALLLSSEYYENEDVAFRYDILLSRVKLINDSPQYDFYVSIDGKEHLEELNRILNVVQIALDDGKSNARRIYALLLPIFNSLSRLGNKTMIQQRVEAGKQRDNQLRAIYLLMMSSAGLLVSGAALSWLLMSNIRALNKTHAELLAYKEKLEDTVAERTAALLESLENERQTNAVYINFLTTVSHQFRTPIAIIDLIAQRFVRWPQDVTKAILVEKAQRIRTAIKRLNLIIDSTINNDRLTESGFDLLVTNINFSEVIQKACSYHSDIYPERRLNLFLPDKPIWTCGDATHLEQVIINFLSNAEKYSSLSTPVDIRLRTRADQIVCSVTDYGIGIPAEDQARIFDRFFRAANVSHLPGSGLGLSLSSMLAHLHGGKITCKSIPGSGTTFEFTLPLDGKKP